jgi:hypothetical protein
MGKKQSEINQEWKTGVVKTLRRSFWRMMITIDSFITFLRLGVEMIWLCCGDWTISETKMNAQWVMWPISESFEQKTSWIWLQNRLPQPSHQLIAKTAHKFENSKLTSFEWCVVVLSWFPPLFKFVVCQHSHIDNQCRPFHSTSNSTSTSIYDCRKSNEKQSHIDYVNSESILWPWKSFSDRKIHFVWEFVLHGG